MSNLERAERATAARLAETVARLGIDSAAAAGRGPMVPVTKAVGWIEVIVTALGHDWSDDAVRRTAQRAMLDTRARVTTIDTREPTR